MQDGCRIRHCHTRPLCGDVFVGVCHDLACQDNAADDWAGRIGQRVQCPDRTVEAMLAQGGRALNPQRLADFDARPFAETQLPVLGQEVPGDHSLFVIVFHGSFPRK